MTGRKLDQCQTCAGPVPRTRRAYCSNECAYQGERRAEEKRQTRRMLECEACGGQKRRIRGSRYCESCAQQVRASLSAKNYARHLRRLGFDPDQMPKEGRSRPRRLADAPQGQKWCAYCQAYKAREEFGCSSAGKWNSYCRPCTRVYNTSRRLKVKFGITLERYNELLAAQGGVCAICRNAPRRLSLAVDHDHATGEVRGLLCGQCNHKLLGAANEDPKRLRRAASYLERPPARELTRPDTEGEPLMLLAGDAS